MGQLVIFSLGRCLNHLGDCLGDSWDSGGHFGGRTIYLDTDGCIGRALESEKDCHGEQNNIYNRTQGKHTFFWKPESRQCGSYAVKCSFQLFSHSTLTIISGRNGRPPICFAFGPALRSNFTRYDTAVSTCINGSAGWQYSWNQVKWRVLEIGSAVFALIFILLAWICFCCCAPAKLLVRSEEAPTPSKEAPTPSEETPTPSKEALAPSEEASSPSDADATVIGRSVNESGIELQKLFFWPRWRSAGSRRTTFFWR